LTGRLKSNRRGYFFFRESIENAFAAIEIQPQRCPYQYLYVLMPADRHTDGAAGLPKKISRFYPNKIQHQPFRWTIRRKRETQTDIASASAPRSR